MLTMLRNVKASPDGIRVYTYEQGKQYDLSRFPHLEKPFLDRKWAEDCNKCNTTPKKEEKVEEKKEVVIEEKSVKEVEEDKSLDPEREDKSLFSGFKKKKKKGNNK